MIAVTRILGLVPGWLYAAALAALLLVLGGEFISHSRTRSALHQERAAWAQAVAKAEQAAREQSERFRAIEQELSHAQATHAAEAAAILDDLDRARAAAGVAAGGLRDAANAAAARARKACADSAAAGLGTPAGDPIGVLADVLGRADARAGELADLADRRGIAGRACEREYDAARAALMKATTP